MQEKLVNPQIIAGLIVFDVLVCNRDRHGENVLMQRLNPELDQYQLQLIDHSHSLIGDLPDFAALVRWMDDYPDPGAYLRKLPQELRMMVTGHDEFDPWLNMVENLPLQVIDDSYASIPEDWRPNPDDTFQVIDLVDQRRTEVRALLLEANDLLPGLKE